jgi:hypothetical protein
VYFFSKIYYYKAMVLSYKKNGFAVPVVLIFVAIFLLMPLVFWWVSSRNSRKEDVKGAETSATSQKGTYIQVTSQSGTWDLLEYLCKTKDECVSGLEAGKKWEGVSGGNTEGHTVNISYSDLWEGYNYLKVFVRPGWSSQQRAFNLVKNETSGFEVTQVENTPAVLVPIENLKNENYLYIVFFDK